MLFERAFLCQVEWRARLAAASGGRQGVHPLHVPGHRDEAPLTLDLIKATQEELTEAHHRFDDAEHRLTAPRPNPCERDSRTAPTLGV
jgi:hypothetical protein